MPRSQQTLTLAEARQIVDAVLQSAAGDGVGIAAVAVSVEGVPILAARMDGVPAMVLAAAELKARTAAALGVPTSSWEERAADDPSFAASISAVPDFVPLSGGEPVRSGDAVVGGMGVSGGTSAEDAALAREAVQVLAELSEGEG